MPFVPFKTRRTCSSSGCWRFRWTEVWLDICELQDGNPASGHEVSRVTDAPNYDAEVYRRSRFLIEFRHGTTATATSTHNPGGNSPGLLINRPPWAQMVGCQPT